MERMDERFHFFSAGLRSFGAQTVRLQHVFFSNASNIFHHFGNLDHLEPFQTNMDHLRPSWTILENDIFENQSLSVQTHLINKCTVLIHLT